MIKERERKEGGEEGKNIGRKGKRDHQRFLYMHAFSCLIQNSRMESQCWEPEPNYMYTKEKKKMIKEN